MKVSKLEVLLAVGFVQINFYFFRFRLLYLLVNRLNTIGCRMDEIDENSADILTVLESVDRVLGPSAKTTQCLIRSYASCLILYGRGIPVRFRIGVRPNPFKAHAWIEKNGVPIGEKDTTKYYVIL